MNNIAICVLGMHRSGTSAMAGTLARVGVDFGRSLLHPSPDNLRGFWEHSEIVRIHERVLWSLGFSWDDVRPLPESWWSDGRVLPFRTEIVRILNRDFDDVPVWGIKDPRLCRLAPLWLDILDELGCRPCFIIIVRHPSEVAQSLRKRNGFTGVKSAFLWLDHNLSAERWTRGRSRAFVGYQQLLDEPRACIEKIAREAGCRFPKPIEEVIDEVRRFLAPELRHNIGGGEQEGGAFGDFGPLVTAAHEALLAACRRKTGRLQATFDRLQAEYDVLVSPFDPVVTTHVADLQARVRELNERLDRMHASTSWRLTRPLRIMERILRRIRARVTRK